MASFDWPPSGGSDGVAKVDNATARNALTPNDGDVVIQLDNDTLYAYNQATTSWLIVGSPSNIAGPASATDKAIVRYQGTTGKTVQNSNTLVDDSGNLLVPDTAGIQSVTSGSMLNLGTGANTTSVNLGTSNTAQTINIGTGTGSTTINLGSTNDTVNVTGTLVVVNTTNLAVADKNIQLNANAIGSGTARGAGLNIRDNNLDTQSYVRVDGSTGTTWEFKAPEAAGVITFIPGVSGFSLNQGVSTTDSPTFSGLILSGFNGVVKASSGTLSASLLLNADIDSAAAIAYSKLDLSNSIVDTDINTAAAIAYSKLALSNSIVNSDIATGAGITYPKLNLSSSIVNGDIAVSAAIAYSKLNLSASIVNSDISGTAAIAYSKLALTGSVINTDISASAAIAYSKLNLSLSVVNGDISTSAGIVYSKLSLSNSIVNSDINSSAAIARSKIAAGTVNQVVINDGSGNLSSSATLSTTLGGTGVSSTATFPTSGLIVTEGSRVVTSIRTDTGTAITALTTDHTIRCTNTAARAVTLPPTPPNGFELVIKDAARNASSFNITVTAGGSDTIEGSSTLLIDSDNASVTLQYALASTLWERL